MDMKDILVETPLTSLLFSKASGRRIPLSGTFELSPICNFSCNMCYVRKTAEEVTLSDRSHMTLEQWIQIAKDAHKQGLLYLLLTGGEPLLWPNFWPLYEQLVKMGFLISINTNGSLIDEEVIRHFREYPPVRINITLYGISDKSYKDLCHRNHVFTRVDRAIMALKEAGIQVKLNCSLTPQNASDLDAIVQYAAERELILSVNTYMFPPLRRDPSLIGVNERFSPEEAVRYNLRSYRLQYGEKVYEDFLKNVKRGSIPPPGLDESCIDPTDGSIRCRAGNASFWITWDGYMTPCGMMPTPKVDIVNHGFDESWFQLTKICEQVAVSGICTKCPNRQLCHSCAAMALTETGSADGIPTYLCKMIDTLRSEANKYLTDLYSE